MSAYGAICFAAPNSGKGAVLREPVHPAYLVVGAAGDGGVIGWFVLVAGEHDVVLTSTDGGIIGSSFVVSPSADNGM
ncbi:MAG: hypothetical protein KAV82_00935 [Phycisphaerae bacterium]|nr:hypothetical protein [Phycisphaerae bacterium]